MRTLALALALVAVGRAAFAQAPVLQWELALDGPGDIVRTEWASTSLCVAAATSTTVFVVDVASGHLLWRWNYRESSRYLRVSELSPMALSPDCKVVVVVGNSDYKYVWAADDAGDTRYFKTQGTPLAARFDVTGGQLAVTTGASRGYLFSPTLDVRWSGPLNALPIRWAAQSAGVAPADAPVFDQGDVSALVGALLWGWGVQDGVSDDGRWRVVTTQEPRGPGNGTVEFYGPEAKGYHGRYLSMRPRWKKGLGCPWARVAADGMFVLAGGDPKDVDSTCQNEQDLRTYVFDRDGRTIVEKPDSFQLLQVPDSAGRWQDITNTVLAKTGKPLKLEAEEPSWIDSRPTPPEQLAAIKEGRQVLVSGSGEWQLVASRHRLLLYKNPPRP